MTPQQIKLVQESFAKVEPIAEQAGSMFYGRLFEQYPEVRPLFKGDMKNQARMLMQMLAIAVKGLDKLETITSAIKSMGLRHAQYGVTAAHYDMVADCLLWTLAQGLGKDFTPECKQAWIEVYTSLAKVMQDGAERGMAAKA